MRVYTESEGVGVRERERERGIASWAKGRADSERVKVTNTTQIGKRRKVRGNVESTIKDLDVNETRSSRTTRCEHCETLSEAKHEAIANEVYKARQRV